MASFRPRRFSPRDAASSSRIEGPAVGFLQSVPVDSETADLSLLPQNIHQRCAEGVGSAKALLIRGAIAQALFFRDFGGFGLEPSRAIPLVNLALPVQDSPEGIDPQRAVPLGGLHRPQRRRP
jgi:hypothetical protein